jgi:hypothetical protein
LEQSGREPASSGRRFGKAQRLGRIPEGRSRRRRLWE